MNTIYRFIDSLWQWIAERVFVRFEFDLPLEKLKASGDSSNIIFSLTHVGIIEFLILSSWCRSQGLGAISITNRRRILLLANPRALFEMVFRRRSYADLFQSPYTGPRLLFCPTSERKRAFEPVPVERLLGELYARAPKTRKEPFQFFPLYIFWRRQVRGAARTPSEYLFGLSSNPNLMGKMWYLIRQHRDSSVKALDDFPMVGPQEASDGFEESEAMRKAKTTRRKLLVTTQQELRVVLGPRYSSPAVVKETLLRDPEIQRVIDEVAKEKGLDRKKVMSQAYSYLTEIASKYRYRTVEFFFFVLRWIFTRLFDGVDVKESELARVRELMKTKPVVFVSCHRSHLDYLIIPYLLFAHDMITPHIVAGINLSFWPIGGFLRGSGAFFIRRSFRGNPLYSICLKKYIEYLLKNRYNIKFFIEGTRSRSGKMLAPAYGVLKMVMEAQKNGALEDVALVPVSVCYDEVPEQGAYTKELGGEAKVKENAKELLKSADIIKKNFGKVYVRLGETVSVREVYGLDKNADATLTLQKTAFQISKSINDITPITAKSLVSTVFLGHRHVSLSLEEILRSSNVLARYANWAGFPLSVDYESSFRRSAEQTVKNLQKNGIIHISETQVPRVYDCESRKRVLLNFYKNNAIHCFVTPSIFLLSLFHHLRGASRTDSAAKLYESVSTTAFELRNILKFEFFFNPTHAFAKDLADNAQYFFGTDNWSNELLPGLIDAMGERTETWDDLILFMSPIEDLLEAYILALTFAKDNIGLSGDKKTVVQRMLKYGLSSELERPESVSLQNFANALLLFENQKMVSFVGEGDKRTVEFLNWSADADAQLELLKGMLELLKFDLAELLRQRGFLASAALGADSGFYEPTSPA